MARNHARLFAVMLGVLLVAGCTQTTKSTELLTVPPLEQTGSNGHFDSLESRADTTLLPTVVMVYRIRPANVNQGQFEATAMRLGVPGKAAQDEKRFVAVGPEAVFETDKVTGSFDYTTRAFEAQTTPLQTVLSDEEYRQRAVDFLTSHGLMEEAADFQDVNKGNVVGTYENGEWVERPYMVEVRFSHKPLNGIAFDKGVGPKIVVQFGEDGTILGAMSIWRNVQPFRTYVLKTPGQALADVRSGKAQVYGAKPDDSGVVESITLSYLNEPLGYNQEFIIPAYILGGTTASNERFAAVVYAIPDEQLNIDPTLCEGISAPPIVTREQ